MRWIVGSIFIVILGLTGYFADYTWKLSTPLLLVSATQTGNYVEPADTLIRTLSEWRLRSLSDCPREGLSITPIAFVAAGHDAPSALPEKVEEVIGILLQSGCDINAYSPTGLTPLHDAILYGDVSLVVFLLEQGADPTLAIRPAASSLQHSQTISGLDALAFARFLQQKSPDQGRLDIMRLLKTPQGTNNIN